MPEQIEAAYKSRDAFSVPVIWVAVALSLLIHLAALWKWHTPPPDLSKPGPLEAPRRLNAQLLPPSPPPARAATPPAAVAARPSASAARAAPTRRGAKPVATPPVLALNRPAEAASRLAPPPVPTPPPPRPAPAPAGDMSAMIEARRRARGESSTAVPPSAPSEPVPAEDDTARRDRIRAANMGIARSSQVFGYDPKRGGGIFQVENMGYDSAEFLFYGWNKDIKRNTKQLIEVRKGGNADIRIAVVRKMIAIIREYENGDFLWDSTRLGRGVSLSARPADNAGLEEFMMREFFDIPIRP